MTVRERALRKIGIGDIFHASAPVTASFICLTLQVKESTILARRVTLQSIHEFDRATGIECLESNPAVIDSVAVLPDDIRAIMLGLDRKYRESEYRRAEDPDWRPPTDEPPLTKEEQRGLIFVSRFYRANPI
jgi:hypothetical protein